MNLNKRYIVILTILVVLGGGTVVFLSQGSLNAERKHQKYVKKAEMFFRNGDLSQAAVYDKKALEYQPDDYELLRFVALMSYNNKEYDDAQKYYQQILKYHSDMKRGSAEAYYHLGEIEVKRENISQAVDYFQKAVDKDPTYVDAYVSLIDSQNKLKTGHGFTVEQQRDAIRHFPRDLGLVRGLLNKYSQAGISFANMSKAKFDELIPVENASGEVLTFVADHLLSYKGNHEVTESLLRQALDKNDTLALAYANLGWILEKRGQYGQAEDLYKKAVYLEKDVELYFYLARYYYYRGDYQKTIDTLVECQQYDDDLDHLSTEYILARAYGETGEFEKALHWLKEYNSSEEHVLRYQRWLENQLK